MDMSTAYWNAQTLLTANRMNLFATLGDSSMNTRAIAAELGTRERPTRLLLNACVGLGLLTESEGTYANSQATLAFLVPGSPGYLGNAIRYADNLYSTWQELETALREDRPPMATSSYTGEDKGITRDFVYGMHDRALGIGRVLTELVDLSHHQKLLDVGGGPGTYASLFALNNPDLECLVMDLPGVVAHAGDIIRDLGVSERVTTIAGDYTTDAFPGGNDVVLISGVFHRETEEGCQLLISKAREALTTGGLLVVSDIFADAGGTSPEFATLFGLNMLLTAPDGGVHADADVAHWMESGGFTNLEKRRFPEPLPHRVVLGRKDA